MDGDKMEKMKSYVGVLDSRCVARTNQVKNDLIEGNACRVCVCSFSFE